MFGLCTSITLGGPAHWTGLVTGLRLDPVTGTWVRFAMGRLGFHEHEPPASKQ